MSGRLPLTGIRIVDFTTFLSGPFCTQILSDMGAEIIKIEAPEGDSSRTIPPHFVGPDSLYYLATNRGKRSIALDLKQPEGVAAAKALIAASDVVIENFRPGICAKLGLSPAEMRAVDPRLIWASISGFGQTGPWRDLPAYDMIVQAMSGVMSLTGEPGGAAVRLGIPAGDLVAGMYAVMGVQAALFDRERTGEGRVIDVAMLDGQLTMLSYQAVYALNAGVHPQPQAARHDSIPTYRSFRAGDGRELVVTANTERMWKGLCTVLGVHALIDDPRFANAGQRLSNKEPLWEALEAAFLTQPAEHWVAALRAASVPAAAIRSVPEALADARTGERDMIVDLTHDDGRTVSVVGNPIKFDGLTDEGRFPPALSEDGRDLLRDLAGYDAERIATLEATGVLQVRPPDGRMAAA